MSSESTELVKADNERIQLALTNAEARQSIIAEVKAHLAAFVPNMDTAAGRKEVASMAYKVARTKTTIDAIGKDMVAEAKAKIKEVDNARKEMRDTLDIMRDDVRKPLTEYEARRDREKEIIENIDAFAAGVEDKDRLAIKSAMETLNHMDPDSFLEIHRALLVENIKHALNSCETALVAADERESEAKRIEAERAELERLRKAEEDRKAKEAQEQVRKEAAARAQKEAEEKAKLQIEQERQRAQEAERRAAEAEARAKAEQEAIQQKAEAEALQRQKDENNRRVKMSEAYFDLRAIIDRTQQAGGDSSKQAEMIVREIADGNVSNVRLEW